MNAQEFATWIQSEESVESRVSASRYCVIDFDQDRAGFVVKYGNDGFPPDKTVFCANADELVQELVDAGIDHEDFVAVGAAIEYHVYLRGDIIGYPDELEWEFVDTDGDEIDIYSVIVDLADIDWFERKLDLDENVASYRVMSW